jgi:hypothetical protein
MRLPRRFFVFIGIIFLTSGLLNAQPKSKPVYKGFPSLVWPKLYDIQYITAAADFDGLDKPIFSDAARTLNGKEITVPGYLVPFENGALKANRFMLSSLPINACFFCGGGGPETVIEIFSIKQITYTDKPVEIKGKLFLNDKDASQMVYILTSAEFLGPIEF